MRSADAARRNADTRPVSSAEQTRSAADTVEKLIERAVAAYGRECGALTFLPERRYDHRVFPTTGQYDWFAGQVLYCLVRHTRPRVVIEFSTSSGYSTTFMAAAVRCNGEGHIHSVDIDATAQDAAARWLAEQGLSSVVTLHLGDCRDVVPRLLTDSVDMLFIDTLHSFDIAGWYLTTVIPHLRRDALVQIHDVMPPEARVRIHGGPPFAAPPPANRLTLLQRMKRAAWLALHLQSPRVAPAPREMLPLHRLEQLSPRTTGEQPTIDGNYFEEAVFIRELLRESDPSAFVYLHRIMARYQALAPQRFASTDRIGRTDARGAALEWNEALWTRAGALAARTGVSRVGELRSRLESRLA
ncbi:MAG TPA: class I SAM-dependent methyltransferase [Vicinamibacterales bacterium]|nr:class I SAM-dependent methyltransferase [Vicinamibacterales bacterium]